MFHSVGIVKCREMLGEGRWVLWDLNPGRKPWCWECSSETEMIVRHTKQSPCPRLVAAKKRRAQTVRAQQEREQNLQILQEEREQNLQILQQQAPPQPAEESSQASEEQPPQVSEEPPPQDLEDFDQDPYFAEDTAKYLVWLGQIGSEEDSHYALYVMKIV